MEKITTADANQNPADRTEVFVQRLTENQNRLLAYVFSLVGDHALAADVVQETNLVLWRKMADYDPQRPFLAWAFAFARRQVLAAMRDRKRDRLVLDEELVELVGADVKTQVGQLESIQRFLSGCLQELSSSSRKLVEERYFKMKGIAELQKEFGKSGSALKVALLRVRQRLGDCIQRNIAGETA